MANELSQEFVDSGHDAWALSYDGCGTEKRKLVCEACGWEHVVTYKCKLKACRECARLRAFQLKRRYMKPVSRFGEPKLLTLTMKPTKQLKAGVRRLRDAFTKFRRRKGVRRWLRAGLYAIECVPKADGYWYIHLHALVDGGYRPKDWISRTWRDVTGDAYIVDIERIPAKKGLRYLLEYLAKGPAGSKEPWSDERIVRFMEVLQDARLIQPFGWLLGAAEMDPPFRCPQCGESIWMVVDLVTGKVYSQLGRLRWMAMTYGDP